MMETLDLANLVPMPLGFQLPLFSTAPPKLRLTTLLIAMLALLAGCGKKQKNLEASIEFSRIPQADQFGRDKYDIIEGRVIGARPGQQIVLYSRSGAWWVQPLVGEPFTKIGLNSKWTNATHLGTEYAALLVEPGYRPPAATDTLPAQGGGVVAVATVKGQRAAPSPSLHFGGYEWRLRDAPSDRGGHNLYDARNAWTDAQGALHLQIAKSSRGWTCAEITLTRSLGYGTYSFVVEDVSRLDPAAVFGMFTWDYAGADQNHREMDIEISRWGNPDSENAQYVVQPFDIAQNVVRFSVLSGPYTHSFRWEPGRVSFRTVRGSKIETGSRPIAQHVFTSSVPSPGLESIRINLYVFGFAVRPLRKEAEIVIDKFQYLP